MGRNSELIRQWTLLRQLAEEELDHARQQYAGGDSARVADSDIQPGLPFLFNRLVNA